MTVSRKGMILVVSAPSGTGKSTLLKRLTAEFPNFAYSISYTTRSPRPGEVQGRDYYFIGRDEFLALKDRDFFAEWACVHDNYYGTPLAPVLDLLAQGRDVLFDIDVQGAAQLRRSFGQGVYVFLFPPSRQALVERLTGRGSDEADVIARRIAAAVKEIEQASLFDYWVVNDSLEEAYAQLRRVYLAERSRACRQDGLVEKILESWNEGNG